MKEYLYEKLEGYDQKGIYPCHMPGHKRQLSAESKDYYKMDITEIDGFDNLHHPEEILKQEEERAAAFYGAKKTFFLVNGSTCGNLSAISACVKKQGTILVARNCHKSVYNAIYLNECKVEYLMPEMIDEYSIVGGITPDSVLQALEKNSDIQAVMITSPTYDGVVSDISEIASVVHRFGIPLIVDEAHGAHFGLDPSIPKNSLSCGADVVIHSLHKTLPSLTQTALLHVQGEIVDYERLERFQSIYQSTSPSYLLLSSISRCLSIMEKEAADRIKNMNKMLDRFYEKACQLKELKVLDRSVIGKNGVFDFDRTKIVISTKNTSVSGDELHEILLKKYKLQMEMAAPEYVQAIMTFMDSEEGFERLEKAVLSIDDELKNRHLEKELQNKEYSSIYRKELMPKSKMTISEALNAKMEWKLLKETTGEVSADFVCLYPPGIPLLSPGEEIEEKHVRMLQTLSETDLQLLGVENGQLKIVSKI